MSRASSLLMCVLGVLSLSVSIPSVSAWGIEANCDTRREWCKDSCVTKLNFGPADQVKCIASCDTPSCPPPSRWVHWPWENEKPCGEQLSLCRSKCTLPSCIQGCGVNYEACFAQWPEVLSSPPMQTATTVPPDASVSTLVAASDVSGPSVSATPVGRTVFDPTCKEMLQDCFTKYLQVTGDDGCRMYYVQCCSADNQPIMPWSKPPSCADRLAFCSNGCVDVYLGASLTKCKQYCNSMYGPQCGHAPQLVATADANVDRVASRTRIANFARRLGFDSN